MKSAPTTIVRRQVSIDFESVPAGPWFPAGGPLEVMFNAASLAFPPTERFFVAAVRDHLDRLTDPVLREQARGFIYQEAMHNKVHIACNDMLARHYPNCRRAEQVSIVTFRWLGRLPRWFRLSLSGALEHFTALVADTLLHHPEDFRGIVPGPVADMWLWHAAEETEHKSVCLDVYRAVLGSGPLAYVNRVAGMLLATPLFLFVMLLVPAILLNRGRPRAVDASRAPPVAAPPVAAEPIAAPAPPSGGSDASRFVGRSMLGLLGEIPWRLYFSYYKPSFHPWDHDNSGFVAEWKERYPDFGQAATREGAGEVRA